MFHQVLPPSAPPPSNALAIVNLPSIPLISGDHGYDNTEEKMHPMFFANGPLLKKRFKIKPFHNIDLYPLIGHILKLTPPPKNVTPNGTLSNVISMLRNTDDEYKKYEYSIL